MSSHELAQVIAAADKAINREDFSSLMEFYAEDATLVVRPGLNATGKEQIGRAFAAIADYFDHSLKVSEGEMVVIEGGDTALVLAQTLLDGRVANGEKVVEERQATYVFRRTDEGRWRCVVDNSYGTRLLADTSAPTLYLVCGKAAAGKSTLARRLAAKQRTVLVEEDAWLARLYPGEIRDLADYVRCTAKVREVLGDHIVALLREGMSVVLDFPANTPAYRQWARGLSEQAGAPHELHYLEVPDETCKARLSDRNASGSHPFTLSEDGFDEITRYFVPPSPEEGLTIIRHR
ncbi:hypothetical protein GMSM_10080 [Geomonas sp. Red276]